MSTKRQRPPIAAAASSTRTAVSTTAAERLDTPGGAAPSDIPEYLVPILDHLDHLSVAAKHEKINALHLHGLSAVAISNLLHIPVRTVHRHIKDANYLLAGETRASREEHLLRAVESARALAAEAWAAYERDCQLRREILAGQHDLIRRRVVRLGRPPRVAHPAPPATVDALPAAQISAAATVSPPRARREAPAAAQPALERRRDGAGGEIPGTTGAVLSDEASDGDLLYEDYERPRHTSQAAKLLAVALAAQREVNRLQGLYQPVPPSPRPVEIAITGPVAEAAAAAAGVALAAPQAEDNVPALAPPEEGAAGAVPLAPPEVEQGGAVPLAATPSGPRPSRRPRPTTTAAKKSTRNKKRGHFRPHSR